MNVSHHLHHILCCRSPAGCQKVAVTVGQAASRTAKLHARNMRPLYRHPGVRGLEQLRCPLPVRVSCAPSQTHGTLFGQPTSEHFGRSAADGEAPGRSDGRSTACRRASRHVTLSHGSSGAAASRESPATARRLTRSSLPARFARPRARRARRFRLESRSSAVPPGLSVVARPRRGPLPGTLV